MVSTYAFLVGRMERGVRTLPPPAELLYRKRKRRGEKKATEFNQSTLLSLHVLYTECANYHFPSPKHGNSPTSKPVYVCV